MLRGRLSPLEEGKHAAESGMDLKAYAEMAGKARETLSKKVMGWRVLASVVHVDHNTARENWRNLAEIHAAPEWLWAALVGRLAPPARSWPSPSGQTARSPLGWGWITRPLEHNDLS